MLTICVANAVPHSKPSLALTQNDNSTTIPKRMEGFYWIIQGPKAFKLPEDKFNHQYLPSLEQVLSESTILSGVRINIPWSDFQPTENIFKFDRLDQIIEIVKKHNKTYKLVLLPGRATPTWVYQTGARSFSSTVQNPYKKDFGEPFIIPIPWNERYLSTYYRAVEELFSHFKNDSHFVATTITVATSLSCEWHLPKSADDMRNWNGLTNAKSNIKETWIDAIDRFASLLPDRQITIDASSFPLQGMEQEAREILAYGVNNYPTQFAIQNNQLHGRRDLLHLDFYDNVYLNRNMVTVGFQNLAGWSYPTTIARQGSMQMTVYNFLQANGQYWEVWWGDGKNAATMTELSRLYERAKAIGIIQFKEEIDNP